MKVTNAHATAIAEKFKNYRLVALILIANRLGVLTSSDKETK